MSMGEGEEEDAILVKRLSLFERDVREKRDGLEVPSSRARFPTLYELKKGSIHHEMNGDTCGVAQGNSPYPFQVAGERIDPSCLPHEGHARRRPNGQQ